MTDDYFYVRIPGGKSLGKTSVWISTTTRDGTELDTETEIELDDEQGTDNLISKPLILVADEWDDRYAGNGFANDNTERSARGQAMMLDKNPGALR